jgi:threonine aldolase
MRQAGILAAGALYALQHHRERLADDHANARRLAEQMARVPGVRVGGDTRDGGSPALAVETNIVNLDLDLAAEDVAREARSLGVLIQATGPKRLRAVTHLDVSRAQIDEACVALASAVARATAAHR